METVTQNDVIVIDDNCGVSKFYAIAHKLTEELQILFLDQKDDKESLEWKYAHKKQIFTLRYAPFDGVSIIAPPGQFKLAMETKHFLERQGLCL